MAAYIITGAAGFIASKVAEMLLQEGHQIVGIDNLNDAYDVRLKHWRLEQLRRFKQFQFCEADVSDRPAMDTIFDGLPPVNAVFNLAARAGVRQSVADPWVYVQTNITGTLNLLELCRKHDIPKFVLASTSSLYGSQHPTPFREELNTDKPCSPYAASKKAAEAMCYTYHHLYGLDVTVMRYFTVYGPASRPDMSPFRFVQWISEGRPVTVYGEGNQTRDFTYVADIARGTIAGLQPEGWAVYNLGGSHPVVLRRLIEIVEELVGRRAELQFQPAHKADPLATCADNSLARKRLNWDAEVSIEQGMECLVRWYQANREWAREIATT